MEPSSAQTRRYWLGGKRHQEQDRFFKEALDTETWQPGDEQDWHACWYTGMPKPAVFKHASADRKINHIPGNNALTVKSRLHDTLVNTRKRIEEQFGADHKYATRMDFLPRVFSMPADYHALQQAALENPQQRWILKPKNAARGKGIRLVSDVADIPMEASWMVQEYLHNTHTMYGRKYVLRLYVLISSIEPFRLYLYHQGFAKLASEPYDINDTDNVYSHLTNPDINALNDGAEVPVEFVDFEHYRQWLRDQDLDDETLFQRIHDMVALTGLSAVESMRRRTRACDADPRGCYELLGIDCLVDTDLKPWILECNLSPSMGVCAGPESGGDIEEQIKGQMVADMVSIVGLNGDGQTTAATLDPEQAVIAESREELKRAGGFIRLYPSADADRYLPYFPLPRLKDMILARAEAGTRVEAPRVQRRHGVEIIAEDQLAVYEAHTGRLNQLNDTATLTWLMALEGEDPDRIAHTIHEAAIESEESQDTDFWTIRRDVWDSLAQWATQGLIMQRGPNKPGQNTVTEGQDHGLRTVEQLRETTEAFRSHIACGGRCFEFFCDSIPVMSRLKPLLHQLECAPTEKPAPRLEVVRDTPGFTIILAGEVIETRRPLSSLAAILFRHLARHTPDVDETVLDATLLTPDPDEPQGLIFAHSDPGIADSLATAFADSRGGRLGRGVRLDGSSPNRVRVIGFPLQLSKETPHSLPDSDKRYDRLLDNSKGRLTPSQLAAGKSAHISAVVVPDTQGVLGDALYRTLSVTEVLCHLLPHCHGPGNTPLAAAQLTRLSDWLSCRSCLLINPQHPEGLVEWQRSSGSTVNTEGQQPKSATVSQ